MYSLASKLWSVVWRDVNFSVDSSFRVAVEEEARRVFVGNCSLDCYNRLLTNPISFKDGTIVRIAAKPLESIDEVSKFVFSYDTVNINHHVKVQGVLVAIKAHTLPQVHKAVEKSMIEYVDMYDEWGEANHEEIGFFENIITLANRPQLPNVKQAHVMLRKAGALDESTYEYDDYLDAYTKAKKDQASMRARNEWIRTMHNYVFSVPVLDIDIGDVTLQSALVLAHAATRKDTCI